MRVIALLALCFAAVAALPADPERIVGGSVTTIDRYPTMAVVLITSNMVTFNHHCGGTILNSRSVLTAAHCTFRYAVNRFRFRVGSTWASSGGAVHPVTNIIHHNRFNPSNLDNDISILRTNTQISFNNNVRAVSIAGASYNLADNQVVWAAGWGAIRENGPGSEQLRHVQVWTVNQNVCRQRYNEVRMTVTDNMLCSGWLDVGGRDQCQGDSGGPLYHNNIQVGVTSFGRGCAQARYPGINVRVSRVAQWINSNA